MVRGPVADRRGRPDEVTEVLGTLTEAQLWEVLSQMKGVVLGDGRESARQLLSSHPQLTRALLQAQVMLGLAGPRAQEEPPARPPPRPDLAPPPRGYGDGYGGGGRAEPPRPDLRPPERALPDMGPPGRAAPPAGYGGYGAGPPPPDGRPAPPPPGGPLGAGGSEADLLAQVLGLTEEQIASLPPEHQEQVRAIKAQGLSGR